MTGEAFRDPLDSHKIQGDLFWPKESQMFRFDPPITPMLGDEFNTTYTHGVVTPMKQDKQIGLVAVHPDGRLIPGVLLALGEMLTEDADVDAFLAKIGYPDVYDEEI